MATVITTIVKFDRNGDAYFSNVGGTQQFRTRKEAVDAIKWIEENNIKYVFEIITSIFSSANRILTYIVPYEDGAFDIVSYIIA